MDGPVTRHMLSRLSKPKRLKAGWFIALAYLFCVLAPSLSFAFGGETAAPCIVDDHGPAMPIHDHAAAMHHVHDDGAVHDHSHHMSKADRGANVPTDAGPPAKSPHRAADTRCCGLVSISAIPAAEIVVLTPSAACSRCEPERYRVVADNAPPGLYRPPIS